MKLLNRSAVVVRPREPYIEWATGLDARREEHRDHFQSHVSVYLLDENLRGDDETPPLKFYYKRIFEHELAAWDTRATHWPKKRDLATFRKWFEVTGESMVFDLGKGQIEAEEYLL